jgi:hypothetical protein
VRLLVDARLAEPDPEAMPLAQGAVALARSEGEALDIDGGVFVEAGTLDPDSIRPGVFLDAVVVAADAYDLRARGLAIEARTPCPSVD